MGIDDLLELFIEDEKEVEFNEDSDYEPEKKVILPSPKRNPPRKRRQPIRYPVQDYEVNVISIKKKQPDVNHTTLRRNITMLHIIAILFFFIINGKNVQIVNDTQNLGRLFGSAHYVEAWDIMHIAWKSLKLCHVVGQIQENQ